jgi:hypothetical protein
LQATRVAINIGTKRYHHYRSLHLLKCKNLYKHRMMFTHKNVLICTKNNFPILQRRNITQASVLLALTKVIVFSKFPTPISAIQISFSLSSFSLVRVHSQLQVHSHSLLQSHSFHVL